MTKAITILTTVVYSDPGEVADSRVETKVLLRSVPEAANVAAQEARDIIMGNVPLDKVCSLVVAHKDGTIIDG